MRVRAASKTEWLLYLLKKITAWVQSTHSLLCLFDRLVIDCSQSIEVIEDSPYEEQGQGWGRTNVWLTTHTCAEDTAHSSCPTGLRRDVSSLACFLTPPVSSIGLWAHPLTALITSTCTFVFTQPSLKDSAFWRQNLCLSENIARDACDLLLKGQT